MAILQTRDGSEQMINIREGCPERIEVPLLSRRSRWISEDEDIDISQPMFKRRVFRYHGLRPEDGVLLYMEEEE